MASEGNGTQKGGVVAPATEQEIIRRKANGTFEKGVSGNPGGRPPNPMRPLILDKLQAGGGAELLGLLWKMAEQGNVQAVRVLLEYSVGKPAMADEDAEALRTQGFGMAMFRAVLQLDKPNDDP